MKRPSPPPLFFIAGSQFLPSSSAPSAVWNPLAMSQTVVLNVRMSCEGCSGAVKRVLGKLEGVESFDIDMEQQKVTVKGNVQPDLVFQTVSKTGKKTSFWEEAEAATEGEAAIPAEPGKPGEPAKPAEQAEPAEPVAVA